MPDSTKSPLRAFLKEINDFIFEMTLEHEDLISLDFMVNFMSLQSDIIDKNLSLSRH